MLSPGGCTLQLSIKKLQVYTACKLHACQLLSNFKQVELYTCISNILVIQDNANINWRAGPSRVNGPIFLYIYVTHTVHTVMYEF